MKTNFLFLFFLLLELYLYSQTITGEIVCKKHKPVQYASIQLLFNSKLANATLTDSVGKYKITVSQKGNYELIVRRIGYKPLHKKIILTKDTVINFVLQIDTTILNPVTIVGKKGLISSNSDRIIVNVKGNIKTTGKETTQILSQLPNLVLSNNSLGMFGKTSVIVYINDHIVRLRGKALLDYLNSLPPDIIKNVEIITTPPANYDAEGNVGIIKINTTKKISPGWKEYFTTRYIKNTYSSGILTTYASYSGKKLFFEATVNCGKYAALNLSNYEIYFPSEIVKTNNPRENQITGAKANLTLEYDFNENNSLIIDALIPFYNLNDVTDIENKTDFINTIANNIDSTIVSNGRTTGNTYTYNSEVFYKHRFNNKKSFFTVSTAYLNNFTTNQRVFSSITYANNTNSITENYKTSGYQNYQIITSKIDFSFPLLKFKVNTGGKLSFIDNVSSNNFYRLVNNNELLDRNLSDKYAYKEEKEAFYFSIRKNMDDWDFKGGLRLEVTNTIGNSLSKSKIYKKNYANFFPTFYISHKLSNKNILSLSYSKRIERPPYQYLNPFRQYVTKYDYTEGNPFLDPSFINNIELNYLFGNTFMTKIYYTSQYNEIGKYVILDSSNIELQVQKPDNFLNTEVYGLSFYKLFNINKIKWLETILQGDFSYQQFISNRSEFNNINGIKGIFILNNTIFIKNNYQIVCNFQEKIPGLYEYRTKGNSFQLDLGFHYIKNNFQLKLLFTDIFKTAEPGYYYFSNGIKQVYNNYYDSRMFIVVLTWRLGNWYNRTLQLPSSSNAEEKRRL